MSNSITIKEFAAMKGCSITTIYNHKSELNIDTEPVQHINNRGGRSYRSVVILDEYAQSFQPAQTFVTGKTSSIWDSITRGKW